MNDLSEYIKNRIAGLEEHKNSLIESEDIHEFIIYLNGKIDVLQEILNLLPKDKDNENGHYR